VHNGTHVALKPSEWFTIELIARGKRIATKVDDQMTADVIDRDEKHRAGYCGLRLLNPSTFLRIRKLEVRELTSEE
jgi:hypothetical protein